MCCNWGFSENCVSCTNALKHCQLLLWWLIWLLSCSASNPRIVFSTKNVTFKVAMCAQWCLPLASQQTTLPWWIHTHREKKHVHLFNLTHQVILMSLFLVEMACMSKMSNSKPTVSSNSLSCVQLKQCTAVDLHGALPWMPFLWLHGGTHFKCCMLALVQTTTHSHSMWFLVFVTSGQHIVDAKVCSARWSMFLTGHCPTPEHTELTKQCMHVAPDSFLMQLVQLTALLQAAGWIGVFWLCWLLFNLCKNFWWLWQCQQGWKNASWIAKLDGLSMTGKECPFQLQSVERDCLSHFVRKTAEWKDGKLLHSELIEKARKQSQTVLPKSILMGNANPLQKKTICKLSQAETQMPKRQKTIGLNKAAATDCQKRKQHPNSTTKKKNSCKNVAWF